MVGGGWTSPHSLQKAPPPPDTHTHTPLPGEYLPPTLLSLLPRSKAKGSEAPLWDQRPCWPPSPPAPPHPEVGVSDLSWAHPPGQLLGQMAGFRKGFLRGA